MALGSILSHRRVRAVALDRLRSEGIYLTKRCENRTFTFFPGDFIGDCLMRDGHYQKDLTEQAATILKREKLVREPLTILEIGANIGTQTNYFFDYFKVERVISVEPDRGNLWLLQINLAQNGIADRVTVVPKAASDAPGTLRFASYKYNSGRSAVVNASVGDGVHEIIEVAADTADNISRGSRPDFIWIDVEEHEISVLRGMRELLGIPMILEFSRHAMTDDDFAFFVREVVPRYSRVRAFEAGFADVSGFEAKQYNLLLT